MFLCKDIRFVNQFGVEKKLPLTPMRMAPCLIVNGGQLAHTQEV